LQAFEYELHNLSNQSIPIYQRFRDTLNSRRTNVNAMESDFTKMLQNSADFFPIINIPRYFLLSKNCSTWKDIFEKLLLTLQ